MGYRFGNHLAGVGVLQLRKRKEFSAATKRHPARAGTDKAIGARAGILSPYRTIYAELSAF